MKRLTSKRELQIAVSLIAMTSTCSWIYYTHLVRPWTQKIIRLGQEIRTTTVLLEHFQQALSQEPQLREEHQLLTQKIQSAQTVLPPEEEMPTLIEFLSDLAGQTGVKIKSIYPQRILEGVGVISSSSETPPAAETSQLYKEIPIQIDAIAGYHQLGTFLSRVESNARPMQLKTLRITNNPKEHLRHAMKVVLTAYFAKAQAPPEGGS